MQMCLKSYITARVFKNYLKETPQNMGTGKKKIEIKRIKKEQDRMVAFSKRRKGLFKKAHQLHTLSGANIAVLVFSPAGKPYIYGDPCFNDIVDKYYSTSATTNTAADDHDLICSNSSTRGADNDEDGDFREIIVLKSWLDRMDLDGYHDVDDLISVKDDLEQVRDWLIKSISDVRE